MGIKVKNLEEYHVDFSQPGSMAVATAIGSFIVPFSGWLRKISAKCAVAGTQGGTGTTLPTVNIKKNGTALFGNNTPLTFASGSQEATYDAELAGYVTVAAGDVLSFDTTVIFNGTSPTQPVGLAIELFVSRKPPLGGLVTGTVNS